MRPMASRRDQNREVVFTAAMELFAERGYEVTTTDEIAARAGVSRRSVFNHFPSKGDFAVEWAARRRDAAVAVTGAAGMDAPTRLRRWVGALGALADDDPAGTEQMLLGWFAAHGPIRHRTGTQDLLRTWLVAGQGDGTIRADVDPDLAAELLFHGYLGVLCRWCATPESDRDGVRPMLEAMVNLVLDGLGPNEAGPTPES